MGTPVWERTPVRFEGRVEPSHRQLEHHRHLDDAYGRNIHGHFCGGRIELPAQFNYGNAGRGILVGPGNVNVDFGLQREFPFGESKRVQFRWEMFNAFNRANFTTPNSSIGNALAGFISNCAPARVMQLGLKIYF